MNSGIAFCTGDVLCTISCLVSAAESVVEYIYIQQTKLHPYNDKCVMTSIQLQQNKTNLLFLFYWRNADLCNKKACNIKNFVMYCSFIVVLFLFYCSCADALTLHNYHPQQHILFHDANTKVVNSGVARGEVWGGSTPPPFASKPFLHSRKVTVIKYYNLSLTTRKIINSHDLHKTNHLGGAGVYCPPIDTILW